MGLPFIFYKFIQAALDPYAPIAPALFETPYNLPTGGTTFTPTGSSEFQTALNNSALGDVIVLTAGTTYSGNFTLPDKGAGTNWIYIISSDLASLPEETRVVAADTTHMPTIRTTNSTPAIRTFFSSHHYRFAGIEIQATNDIYNIVELGLNGDGLTSPTSSSQLPNNITFDRCYIHSTDDAKYAIAGILGMGKYIAVVNCRIENIKAGPDASAIQVWYGDGPYKIVNNFLEATGENILFGGEAVPITNNIPSDIEVRGNHLFKRLSWEGDIRWNVKNLFELKLAQRVLVTGNVMENNWADAQNGMGILFTVRNQSPPGTSPWAIVQDVRFEYNYIINSPGGVNILAEDNLATSEVATRIYVCNNIFTDAEMMLLNLTTGGEPLMYGTFSHNTFMLRNDGNDAMFNTDGVGRTAIVNFADSPALWANYWKFQNNLCMWLYYGQNTAAVVATKTDNETMSYNGYILNPSSSDNAFWLGAFATALPADFKVDNLSGALFTDYSGGNYSLQSGSPFYHAASDGTDIGVNWTALQTAISGVA
jgi:hypothetical protein